ncbi:RNA polymerase sigma factor (sigma-70 family) [Paenibacillus taihuensis]|uniref:RNA polymerase sigma factor (Sigma-70 family) n=1 Tax=Paenibacillus taihuensis TaxID=1156355 RepID=A0A3D9SHR1_9BACL|nr:sigma-70 family RNA polymerase sigma factor [Paenibacillus taihuensis]REE91398.1 RNA polymerase sigma factor (sigma-70 family) [Paenibacillus taihuensis]
MENNNETAELVALVKRGETAAFEQIVTRYRSAALSWAREIVRDVYLAEDIVQEAFLRMRDKLGSLEDDAKFTAWFRLMVRRTAMNAIRGKSGNEAPIDLLGSAGTAAMEAGGGANSSFGNAGGDGGEPDEMAEWEEQADRDELVEQVLQRLSGQAREVLRASAFDDATPEELAARFGMNKSNVYNIFSRARVKTNDERFSSEVARYLKERRSRRETVAKTLAEPSYSSPYAFISVMIGEALRYVSDGAEWSTTELMGISGDAFRLNTAAGCNWRGISTFDWSYTGYQTMERLGIEGTCFGRPQRRSITPEQQVHLLAVIQGTIDRGVPAIIRNMNINEFGYVYGYDDEAGEIKYYGANRLKRSFRYDKLGRTGEEPPLFVLGIRGQRSQPMPGRAALQAIVNHARGKEPPLEGFAYGLKGYELWLEAVERGGLNLHGHAYQVAILAEARQRAASYLQGLAVRSGGRREQGLAAAAACYGRVGEEFRRLYPSFPFGYGGSHGNRMGQIRSGLQAAYEAETEGIAIIEHLLQQW